MASTTGISQPILDEHVLAIDPPAREVVPEQWRRRARMFAGRSLTHEDLEAGQGVLAEYQRRLTRSVSHGIVQGLEASLAREAGRDVLYLHPGFGLAWAGEDVSLPTTTRIALADLPVLEPFAGGGVALPAMRVPAGAPYLVPQETRQLGGALGSRIADGPAATTDRVMVLLAMPVTLRSARRDLPEEGLAQFAPDRRDEPFLDIRMTDGLQLALCPWPAEVTGDPAHPDLARDPAIPWPDYGLDAATLDDPLLRSRLARAVFAVERAFLPGDAHPWEQLGVPLALLAFAADGQVAFLDRAVVARQGGQPRPRTQLVRQSGSPVLWQARIDQFIGQVQDLMASGVPPQAWRNHLVRVPPVGILPASVLSGAAPPTQSFFPEPFGYSIVPIPLEQAPVLVRECASLQPIDLRQGGIVDILVPVPEADYDPALFDTATPDPAFAARLDELRTRLKAQLGERGVLRARFGALRAALDGSTPAWPGDAADQEAAEQGLAEPPAVATDPEGTVVLGTVGDGTRYTVPALGAFAALDDFKDLPQAIRDVLPSQGLDGVIARLTDLDQRANDLVDTSFTRVRADLYRVRQMMLGESATSRFVTTPALAEIVKQDAGAPATKAALNQYMSRVAVTLRSSQAGPAAPAAGPPAAQAAPQVPDGRPPIFRQQQRAGFSSVLTDSVRSSGTRFGGVFATNPAASFTRAAAAAGVASPAVSAGVSLQDSPALAVLRQPPDVTVSEKASPILRSALLKDSLSSSVAGIGAFSVGDARNPAPRPQGPDRSATLGERIAKSDGAKAVAFAQDGLTTLMLRMKDLHRAGFLLGDLPMLLPVLGADAQPAREVADITLFDKAAEKALRALQPDADEAFWFSEAVRLCDLAIVQLRFVEGRIDDLEALIATATRTRSEIAGAMAPASQALAAVDAKLAESLHDKAVATALQKDDEAAVSAVNARRLKVIAAVRTVIYRRPRSVSRVAVVDVAPVAPAAAADPVVACLGDHDATPPELKRFVDRMRQAPVAWFPRLADVLEAYDRPADLAAAIDAAGARATLARPLLSVPMRVGAARPLVAIGRIADLTDGMLQVARNARPLPSPALVTAIGHIGARRAFQRAAVLGDLIEAGQGKPEVSRRALAELDELGEIATCLSASFAAVDPVLRMRWADLLSEDDTPPPLASLAELPGWSGLSTAQRRRQQLLTDALYARLDGAVPEARGLAGNLVRVAILVAAHAPIDRIVAAELTAELRLQPQATFTLRLDVDRARIGMGVHLRAADNRLAATAVITDLRDGYAEARIVGAPAMGETLKADAVVQLVDGPAAAAARAMATVRLA